MERKTYTVKESVGITQVLADAVHSATPQRTPPADDMYFAPLLDTLVPKHLSATLTAWRDQFASSETYHGSVAWLVRLGFTLRDAKRIGPYVGGFPGNTTVDNHNFNHDVDISRWHKEHQTPDAIVFWMPRFVPGTAWASEECQRQALVCARERFGLPAHHLAGFGEASMVVGLALTHFALTNGNERVPLREGWVRTETPDPQGMASPLRVGGFDSRGLQCGCFGSWWPLGANNLGIFPFGIEPLPPEFG